MREADERDLQRCDGTAHAREPSGEQHEFERSQAQRTPPHDSRAREQTALAPAPDDQGSHFASPPLSRDHYMNFVRPRRNGA